MCLLGQIFVGAKQTDILHPEIVLRTVAPGKIIVGCHYLISVIGT